MTDARRGGRVAVPERGHRVASGPDAVMGRTTAITLLVAGGVGLVAAAVLLVEKVAVLADPAYVPTCSINPVVSCGSVMTSWQAEVFGVPNPLLGVAGFTVVVTTGVALLAGARLARWYWNGLLAGALLGTALVHWLVFQSMFRIGALCPYCMAVWVATIVVLVTAARRACRLVPRTQPLARWLDAHHVVVVTAWCLAVAGLAVAVFWDSWMTMLA